MADDTAYVMAASAEAVTFSELNDAANQGAQLFRSLGLARGDHVAILLENHPSFLKLCFAAQRAGLYYTPISWRLQSDEIAYIVNNCEARAFVTSNEQAARVTDLAPKTPGVEARFMLDGVAAGYQSWEEATEQMPREPIADESPGAPMVNASGAAW